MDIHKPDTNHARMAANKVVTKDYPENLKYGIMVCGINYGESRDDEKCENLSLAAPPEKQSFFSDLSVRKTDRFRNRIVKWLKNWGLELETAPGKEGPLERRFFQCNWLDTQSRSMKDGDYQITFSTLIKESDGFLALLSERKPSVIFFGGSILMDAAGCIPKFADILGAPSEEKIYFGDLPGYRGRRFRVRVRNFGSSIIIGLPHPTGSLGLSDRYMASIKFPEINDLMARTH